MPWTCEIKVIFSAALFRLEKYVLKLALNVLVTPLQITCQSFEVPTGEK